MTEEQEGPKTGNVVDPKYREKYGKDGHTDDPIARYLAEATHDEKGKTDIDALWEVGKANDIDMNKYANLNPGMQRMTLSNRLRGLHNKGVDVKIGDRTVKGSAEGKKKAAEKEKAAAERAKAKEAKAKAKEEKKGKKAA